MASGYSDLSEIQKNNGLYGVHQKPPKINLISEKPRRESLVERELSCKLARTDTGPPTQQVQQQVNFDISHDLGRSSQAHYAHDNFGNLNTFDRAGNQTGYTTTSVSYDASRPGTSTTTTTTRTVRTQQQQQQQQQQPTAAAPSRVDSIQAYTELVNDLAAKEAKLRREMAYLNQQLSPWSRPRQVRAPRQEPDQRSARSQQRWVKECPSSRSSSRPTSRASSTRSNTEADLMEKSAKLLQDAVEIERKPLKKQEILIESGARRTEEVNSPSGGVSSIHTAIITVPKTEIDNKSPLPFAYDNFSTLGVRGNIASVGAAPPETPYPPIYPVVKRTPSPANRMY